jgi:hypothetical protein
LAGLSVLYLKVELHHVDLAVVDDKSKNNSQAHLSILSSALSKYGLGILEHLDDPVINAVQRNIAVRSFRNAGVPLISTLRTLQDYRNKLKHLKEDTGSHKVHPTINCSWEHISPESIKIEHQNILLKLAINRVALKMHQLTYDYRLILALDSLSMYDNSRRSIFDIQKNICGSENDDMDYFKNNDPMMKDSSKRCGISLEIVMKDHRYPFGSGGISRSTIVNISDPSQWQENCILLSMNAHHFSVHFDSNSIAEIFTEVEIIREKVASRTETHISVVVPNMAVRKMQGKVTSDRDTTRSPMLKWHFYLTLRLEELSCLLSNKERTFSLIKLQKTVSHTQLNYLNNLMIDVVVDSLDIFDLSGLGKQRRNIVWKGEKNGSEDIPMVIGSVFVGEDGDTALVFSTNFLRLNATCRFIYEFVDYVHHCIIRPLFSSPAASGEDPTIAEVGCESDSDDDLDSTSIRKQSSTPRDDTRKDSQTTIVFFAFDNQIHIPRNSLSKDVMCAVISEIEVSVTKTKNIVEAPSSDCVSGTGEGHLYFDAQYNMWRRTTPLETDELLFASCLSGNRTTSSNPGSRITILASHIDVYTTVEPLQRGQTHQKKGNAPELSPLEEDVLEKDMAEEDVLEINDIDPSIGEVFQSAYVRRQSREWAYLSDCGQKWEKNTREIFNLQVVVDIGQHEVKVLLGDTDKFARLTVVASLAEYHIFLGLWFDNVGEIGQYLTDDLEPILEPVNLSENDINIAHERLSEYGSQAYLEYMLGRPCSFELLLVRAEVMLCCALDINHYSVDVPMFHRAANMTQFDREKAFSSQFGKKGSVGEAKYRIVPPDEKLLTRRVIPFLDVRVAGVILCVRNFEDVIRLFISGETLEAYDVSKSKQSKTVIPLILRVSKRVTTKKELQYNPAWPTIHDFTYGLPDMTYGFCQNSPTIDSIQDVPFKFTLLSATPSNWMTLNIGVNNVDANIYNLDSFLLASDFFSIYFRYQEFGHPGVATYYSYPLSKFPYGGLDLRLFVTNPHVALLHSDNRSSSTQSLILEAENGFSFRYIYDTAGSTRFEVSLYDFVAVLAKRYCPPSIHRGARGCSGSGRGLRTTIERLNLDFVHHTDTQSGVADIKLKIFAVRNSAEPNATTMDGGIVDINSVWDGSHNIQLSEPTCLRPIKRFQSCLKAGRSCDIVTCYEDILFCLTVVKTIFSLSDPSLSLTQPDSKKSPMMFVWSLEDLRFMLVDNVLGMHLPLFQVCFCHFFSFSYQLHITIFP